MSAHEMTEAEALLLAEMTEPTAEEADAMLEQAEAELESWWASHPEDLEETLTYEEALGLDPYDVWAESREMDRYEGQYLR